MNLPLVSIIIPVYNRQHLIQRSIESILDQSYKHLEVIIIDDASTDLTELQIRSIKDERIRYYRNETNIGPSGSRNKGIKLALGKYVAFQDSDDEWYPRKLEKQMSLILTSTSKVAAVYCGMEFYDYSSGLKCGESIKEIDFRLNFTRGNHFLTPANVTVLVRKSALEEVGCFDERLKASEDTELAIRISKNFDYLFVPEALVKVTRNHDQLMGNSYNYIVSKEIILSKHRNYLSKSIVFNTYKIIANYYILVNNYSCAREYLIKALGYKINIKVMLQLILLFFPALTDKVYQRKYAGKIPLSSGLKQYS